MANSILDKIEKISGEKFLRTEEPKIEEPNKEKKPRNKDGWANYWKEVKEGKRKHGGWKKKKDEKTEEPKKEEPKKEEPKPEPKLDKNPPDKEAEEIKEKMKYIPDEEFLKKGDKAPEDKPDKTKKEIKIDSNLIVYGIIGVVVIVLITQLPKIVDMIKGGGSAQKDDVPPSDLPIYRSFDIGGGRVIKIRKN